jgi:hypothetical protein
MAQLVLFLFYIYIGIYAILCSVSLWAVCFIVNNYFTNYGGYYYFLYVPTILIVNYFLILFMSSGKKQINRTFNKEGV